MRVLQLTYRVPYPPTDGGAIGIYNIVKGLHENECTIDLLSINTPKHQQPANCMSEFANQYDVFVNTRISGIKLLSNVLFRSIPYNIERFYSKKVIKVLCQLLEANNYDFIQLEGSFVLKYVDDIRKTCNTPIIVRAHNIEYVIWERLSKNEKNPLKRWFYNHLSKRLKKFERDYYNKVDGIAAITEEDKNRLRSLNVHVITEVIPAGIVLEKYMVYSNNVAPERNTLFFIGALDWMPNLEGLNWFLENIWPTILQINPKVQLHIAGKSAPNTLINSRFPNTTIHGFVEDAMAFKKKYDVMLVPLLSGGGMRVKILEGFAAKKCIVSTSIGAEGIAVKDNHNIVIADTIQEWVKAIFRCLEDVELKNNIEQGAFISAMIYENKTVTKGYLELFKEIKTLKER